MRKKSIFTLIFFIICLFLSCSKPPMEAGDAAMKEGKFSEAIKFYLEAEKEKPDDNVLKEKIATAYFKQGIKMKRVIRAFEARVELGTKYLPETLSDEMKKTLCEVHYALALAYKDTEPENPHQKKEFFDKTLDNFEKARTFDPANQEAEAAMKEFMEMNFQEILNKGMASYKKGASDPVYFFSADYYLSKALKLKPDQDDLKNYIKQSREKTLNIPAPGQSAAFAITDRKAKDNYAAFYIVLINQGSEAITVNANQFYLISATEQEIQGQSSDLFAAPLQTADVQPDGEIEGVVTFQIEKGQQYLRCEFRGDSKVLGYKNLP